MSITIQMGENPKLTCVIILENSSFSNGTATATFNYSLNAMSGYNYWGYGVKLEYGGTSSLGSSVTLCNNSPSQWSTKTGSVTITKTGVSTSPQLFYFRLNSVASTAGTPGSTSSYSVDFNVDKPSVITSVDFGRVERSWCVNFTSYNSSYYHDLHIDIWRKNESYENRSWLCAFRRYNSGEYVRFSDENILAIYKREGIPVHDGTINVQLLIRTFTSGGSEIGTSTAFADGYFWGTSKFNKNGSAWWGALPFVNINGTQNPCLSYLNVNGTWKRCLCE